VQRELCPVAHADVAVARYGRALHVGVPTAGSSRRRMALAFLCDLSIAS